MQKTAVLFAAVFLFRPHSCSIIINDHLSAAGTGWTALHAAAFQEHGKVVKYLLESGAGISSADLITVCTSFLSYCQNRNSFVTAGVIFVPVSLSFICVRFLLICCRNFLTDPEKADRHGRTPTDYASISQGIWPFFQMKGCEKTSKLDLVEKVKLFIG
jgi:hypothetical protein